MEIDTGMANSGWISYTEFSATYNQVVINASELSLIIYLLQFHTLIYSYT